MKDLKRSGRLILIFLALGWLTNCGGSIVKEKEVVDTVNPSITITDPADGTMFDQTIVVVRGTASDPEPSSGIDYVVVGIDYVVVGTDYVVVNGVMAEGTTDWEESISGLAQGPNTLVATVWDEAGNFSSALVNVFVDSLAPEVVITSPTMGSCVDSVNVVVHGTVTEISSYTILVTVTSATYTYTNSGTSFPITVIGVIDGVYKIDAVVTDAYGNVGPATTVNSVVVDTVSPASPAVSPVDGEYCVGESITVTTDEGGPEHCTTDGSVPDCTSPAAPPIIVAGITLRCIECDACLNPGVETARVYTVDITGPAVTITQPTLGEFLATDTVVVKFTASDGGSGPDTNSGVVTLSPYGTIAATYSAGVFTATFAGVANGGYTATACVNDLCGNTGCASVSFSVGFVMSIESPTDGAVVVTVNGNTGSVIASIPFDLTWVNGTSPYDTSGLTVLANGLTTTPDGLLSITSPSTASTTASGRIQVACDVSAGSFGTTTVTITAYGVSDAIGPAAPGSVTVTVQLGEIGVEDVTVYETGTTFKVPVNVYYDGSCGDAFGSFDLEVTYDTTVIKAGLTGLDDCSGDNPVSGSDPASAFYAFEFDSLPAVPTCSNTLGLIRLSNSQGISFVTPVGFFNVANITFRRVGIADDSTDLSINLIDYANSSGDSYFAGTKPACYAFETVWPTWIMSGRVDIISTP